MEFCPKTSKIFIYGTFFIPQDGLITSVNWIADESPVTEHQDQTKIPILESVQAVEQLSLGKGVAGNSDDAQESR